jgi:hypothetical protein
MKLESGKKHRQYYEKMWEENFKEPYEKAHP